MTTLSDQTLGLLTDIGAARYSRSELETMLMRGDLEQYAPPGSAANKRDLLLRHLREAKAEALRGSGAAHRALLDFVLEIVKTIGPNIPAVRQNLDELYEALLADGYQLALSGTGSIELLPTDAGPVPLAAEITALERELGSRNYNVALNHYRQAISAFRQHDYEAANSQLRTTLEDLAVQLAIAHTGYIKPANQGGGGPAIRRLTATANLSPHDGGDMLSGLWSMTHTSGSHPGTSNADETRFRVQVITATARLLLHRFQ
jgi:hypothetical protein